MEKESKFTFGKGYLFFFFFFFFLILTSISYQQKLLNSLSINWLQEDVKFTNQLLLTINMLVCQ